MADSAEEVMALYRARINGHDFDRLAALIADNAVFWFGDGSHVGLASIRAAFEATWKRFENETYWLEDLQWLAVGSAAASCIYGYCWRATIGGVERSGQGRGTSVVRDGRTGWQIVHEHLSALP
ncbi:YybH family protein [uncultured Devosia sp.]|uniref:YybH family protein n=1 Tax=uncultured Devosia sp. TaxID=211434 RepID=UPI0035CA25BB